MIVKRLLCPQRVRRVPRQFSWVDHRLVRDGHIERCGVEALALYLLLVSVGDAEGLSYYSDRRVAALISLDEVRLREARRRLVAAGLIAYRKPLYQVLSLEDPAPMSAPPRGAHGCASAGEILRAVLGGEP